MERMVDTLTHTMCASNDELAFHVTSRTSVRAYDARKNPRSSVRTIVLVAAVAAVGACGEGKPKNEGAGSGSGTGTWESRPGHGAPV